jgi:hypothetical protein
VRTWLLTSYGRCVPALLEHNCRYATSRVNANVADTFCQPSSKIAEPLPRFREQSVILIVVEMPASTRCVADLRRALRYRSTAFNDASTKHATPISRCDGLVMITVVHVKVVQPVPRRRTRTKRYAKG